MTVAFVETLVLLLTLSTLRPSLDDRAFAKAVAPFTPIRFSLHMQNTAHNTHIPTYTLVSIHVSSYTLIIYTVHPP